MTTEEFEVKYRAIFREESYGLSVNRMVKKDGREVEAYYFHISRKNGRIYFGRWSDFSFKEWSDILELWKGLRDE